MERSAHLQKPLSLYDVGFVCVLRLKGEKKDQEGFMAKNNINNNNPLWN